MNRKKKAYKKIKPSNLKKVKKGISFLFKATLFISIFLGILFTIVSKNFVHIDNPMCKNIHYIIKNKCMKAKNAYLLNIENNGTKSLIFELNGNRYEVPSGKDKSIVVFSKSNSFDITPIIVLGVQENICWGKTQSMEVFQKCQKS